MRGLVNDIQRGRSLGPYLFYSPKNEQRIYLGKNQGGGIINLFQKGGGAVICGQRQQD